MIQRLHHSYRRAKFLTLASAVARRYAFFVRAAAPPTPRADTPDRNVRPTGQTFRPGVSLWLGLVALVGIAVVAPAPSSAQEAVTRAKKASFEDVRDDLKDAITKRGLTIDYHGFIGRMLERTGADVGSTKPLYKEAEFFTFCSAKLSRDTMEADLANIALCPYVVFVYEAAAKPGEVVVGYRPLPARGGEASKKALGAINALLDGIIADAIK